MNIPDLSTIDEANAYAPLIQAVVQLVTLAVVVWYAILTRRIATAAGAAHSLAHKQIGRTFRLIPHVMHYVAPNEQINVSVVNLGAHAFLKKATSPSVKVTLDNALASIDRLWRTGEEIGFVLNPIDASAKRFPLHCDFQYVNQMGETEVARLHIGGNSIYSLSYPEPSGVSDLTATSAL